MTTIPRETIRCFICGAELSGCGLDTYGEPGHERCESCFIHDPELQPYDFGLRLRNFVNAEGQLVTYLLIGDDDDENEAFWEDDEADDDGMIEQHGELYCGACGILAQSGCEDFDWCDHITGDDCPFFYEDHHADDDDDDVADFWGEDD